MTTKYQYISVGVIVVLFVLLVHSFITIEQLSTRLLETETWFNETEAKIEELKAIANDTKNTCELYLQDEMLLMDNGNDQSQ